MSDKKIEKKQKLVIFTGYACNNNCVFCINADKRAIRPRTTGEILADIYASKGNLDVLELIGGEVTIRDDFFTLLKAAKKIGVKEIIIATNGRMFSDYSFTKKAIEAGLGAVIFSIHGSSPVVHDSLTMAKGSFSQLKKGIDNFRKLGFKKINGNTTVVKQNMKDLPNIANFHVKQGIRNVEYIFVDPNYGGAKNNFDRYVPRISQAAPYMRKALDIGIKAGFTQWKARYVPLCHFNGYFDHISEINERKLFFVRHSAPEFRNEDVLSSRMNFARKKTSACKGCSARRLCEGIWIEYLKHYGDSELKPIKNEK